jgi:hypothetical protein
MSLSASRREPEKQDTERQCCRYTDISAILIHTIFFCSTARFHSVSQVLRKHRKEEKGWL